MTKIVHYREGCIGCHICVEMQPEHWRMSKKDGKATLLRSELKKDTYILEISVQERTKSESVASHCPVKVIKVF